MNRRHTAEETQTATILLRHVHATTTHIVTARLVEQLTTSLPSLVRSLSNHCTPVCDTLYYLR